MSIHAAAQPTQRELDALETKKKIFLTSVRLFAKYGFDTVKRYHRQDRSVKGYFLRTLSI